MYLITLVGGNLLLCLIFLQDLKYRAVSWFLFPAVTLVLLSNMFLSEKGLETWMYQSLLNLCFLLVNMMSLMGWFTLKKISVKIVLNEFMGIGDILFFVVMALCLPFPVFPLVFVASLILALLTGITIFRHSTVPLAGLQALILVACLTLDYFRVVQLNTFNLIGI